MPRKARKYIITPNTLYHIVCRGNNKRRIFRTSRDYQKLLKIIELAKKKFPFYLYSYSLLPNHYHLGIETIKISISKIMHYINFSYANYFHYRYKTSGHLFQGRFFSSLIEKESYFWEFSRYIDLNAVRAGLVKKPEDYQWGSYKFYFQKNYRRKLIDYERFLEYGGENLEEARIQYLQFVEVGLELNKKPNFPFGKNMI